MGISLKLLPDIADNFDMVICSPIGGKDASGTNIKEDTVLNLITLQSLRQLKPGQSFRLPSSHLLVERRDRWFVLENRLVKSRRFYSRLEDMLQVLMRVSV